MSKRQQRMIAWIVVFGYLGLVLGAGFFGAWWSRRFNFSEGAALFLLVGLQAVALVIFAVALYSLVVPQAYREVRKTGLSARAWVLSATLTGWKMYQGKQFNRRTVAHEYQIRVRVERSGTMPYETTIFATLVQPPTSTTTLDVLVHPSKPDVIVLRNPL